MIYGWEWWCALSHYSPWEEKVTASLDYTAASRLAWDMKPISSNNKKNIWFTLTTHVSTSTSKIHHSPSIRTLPFSSSKLLRKLKQLPVSCSNLYNNSPFRTTESSLLKWNPDCVILLFKSTNITLGRLSHPAFCPLPIHPPLDWS